jgi:hypothetical protein
MVDQSTELPPEATSPAATHGLLFPERRRPATHGLLFPERRRPGRTEVEPELIPLLRADEIMKSAPHDNDDDQKPAGNGHDRPRAARRVVGLFLAAPFWIGVGAFLWWWFED